jgi:hypothetical protein
MENFRQTLTAAANNRPCVFDYSDEQIDPEGKYLVDCRVTGKNKIILHVYAAYSDAKAKDSMLSMYYYDRHRNKALR